MMRYDFQQKIDTTHLSRKKWEYEIERTGYKDLLSFGTADMDYLCPQPILNAIHRVADVGHLGYPHIRAEYYDTIQAWLERTAGWKINARKSVIPHAGLYMSSITAMDAFSEPGDEIIIQSPVHTRFTQLVADNGRRSVCNPLKRVGDHYEMDYTQLESVITSRTRIFWLCNPHNPVGRAWTEEELRRLGEICLAHRLYIMTDDIYCGMVYPGYRYVPIASLSEELEQITVSCYSPSKCFNTTGANQSFVVIGNPEMRKKYRNSLHKTDFDYSINVIGLAITQAAYGDPECDRWLADFMVHIKENHDFLNAYIKEKMPGITSAETDSTYFAWLDISSLPGTSAEITRRILDEVHVLVNDGSVLGEGGEGYIRMNLACPLAVLEEGLDRIKKVFW